MATRQYQSGLETGTVTIANGASLSDAEALDGKTLVGLCLPSGWTAAAISFDADPGDGTYRPLYYNDQGTTGEVRVASADVPTAATRFYALVPSHFAGVKNLKVRSGLNGAAVNQGAERVLTLVYRSL